MRKISILSILLLLVTNILTISANDWNIKKGEVLTYRIAFYSLLTRNIKGGDATLSVLEKEKKIDGKNTYHAILQGQTSGVIEWFYKISNHYETYMDTTTLFPVLYLQKIRENKYSKDDSIVFNQNAEIAKHDGKITKIHKGTNDFVSMLYSVRQKDISNLKKGDIFLLPMFIDRKAILSKVKYIGKKSVCTKYEKRVCYGFKPEVPKGKLFKKKYPATIWISADKDRLPMLIEAKMRVGKIKLEILKADIPKE